MLKGVINSFAKIYLFANCIGFDITIITLSLSSIGLLFNNAFLIIF